MQRLEVSCAVRHIYTSLGAKRLKEDDKLGACRAYGEEKNTQDSFKEGNSFEDLDVRRRIALKLVLGQ